MKAMSDTYPDTLAASRGKTLYRYNIREVEVTDGGKTRTAYEYDEAWITGNVTKAKVLAAMRAAEAEQDTSDIGEAASQYQDAKSAISLSNLSQLTYAELDTYIQTRVTDMASAKEFLKKLARVVLALLKE